MCPGCRSFAVIFTLDHVSLSGFTALVLLTTFVATRRCRCLLQSVRVNVMPAWLLFVISGILAGRIPGFCIELCCFLHPLNWPLVLLSCFSLLFSVWGQLHHGTQGVIMHVFLSFRCFLGLFLVFWFSVFCLVFWMIVTVHRTMYRSSTSLLFAATLQQRPTHDSINQLIPIATCS